MQKLLILDPSKKDALSAARGGGRVIQMLRENLHEARFVSDLSRVGSDSALLIPFWKPFEAPILNKRMAQHQALIIFDAIPLKYPQHFPSGLKGRLRMWQNSRALRHFDTIITISEASKADIVRYLPVSEDRVTVIYPTVTKSFLNPKIAKNSGVTRSGSPEVKHSNQFSANNYVLYVGDVNWNKNLVTLARAVKTADVQCVFVGKPFQIAKTSEVSEDLTSEVKHNLSHPWMREFKNFLEEVGDDPRFISAGFVPDSELVNLYKHAVCNMLISRDEGFGMSYLEAASQSCPSVLSDIDVFHEVADNTALFADPDDHFAVAEKIKEFMNSQKKRDKLGLAARARVHDVYSPRQFIQKIST